MSKSRAASLKTKIIVGTIFIILIVTFCSMLLSYRQTYSILQRNIEFNAENSTKQNAEIISNWLMSVSREIDALSGASAMRGMEWNNQESMLKGVLEDHPDYEMLFVADLTGYARTTADYTMNVAGHMFFQKALYEQKVSFSDPIISSVSGKPVFVVARPIIGYDGRTVAGVLGATVKLDYIWDLANRTNINGHGYGWVIDSHKTTIAHPVQEYIGNNLLLQSNSELQAIAEQMAAGNLDLLSYQESGEDMTVAFAPIPITGWSIATVAKTKDLYSDLTLLRSSFVKLTLFVLSIGVLLSYVFARGLAQPLVKLTNTVQLVAEGDFSQTLAMDRKDEIGQLAVAFNRMVTAIQRLLDAIRNSGNQVERYSLELSSSMEENNASITEIANAAAELATTVEQMNERSQEMLVTTKEISNKVVAGEQALDNTVTQTAVLKEDIQGLYNAIDSLNAHSVEVEKIVEAIAHIAEQTNLLALNASIEAARAGEHGRGFAVVAEEIRQLSDQSKLATENIAQSLAGIKKDVQQAVKGIESGIIQAEDTADIVAQSSVTLHEVLDSVTNLTEGLNEILNNIATVGEGSQQMAAMTEEQSAIVEHLSTASTELSKMSQELLGLFQEFIL